MKKITTNFLRTAGLSLAAAAVALCGMTACTNDDNIIADEPANGQPAAVKTYQVSIPASIGDDGTTRAVSFDGKKCNLTGTLTGGTISDGYNLKLMYNLTNVNTNKEDDLYKANTWFKYDGQDGTQSGVMDGAEATVTVSSYTGGVLTTTPDPSPQRGGERLAQR